MLTLTDVIIEAMPFSDSLLAWCKQHPEFKEGLKFANSTGFLALGAILTSYATNASEDEVIGFLVYDIKKKYFKQDFIVNVGGSNNKFILYSKLPNKKYGQYVQHINNFWSKYAGDNNNYSNTHHLTIIDIVDMKKPELVERAERTIFLAEQIEKYGDRALPSQLELRNVLSRIRAEKDKAKKRNII